MPNEAHVIHITTHISWSVNAIECIACIETGVIQLKMNEMFNGNSSVEISFAPQSTVFTKKKL